MKKKDYGVFRIVVNIIICVFYTTYIQLTIQNILIKKYIYISDEYSLLLYMSNNKVKILLV